VKRGGGRIILTSSTQGRQGTEFGAFYSVTKWGIIGLMKSAALEQILTTRTPLGAPWIEPEDVVPVVVFLASDAARMVLGATFDVTGGDSANNTA
jgi:NAD(P)-dependent dehydrogenase (short-subunit alcohol dehydrogenase family)